MVSDGERRLAITDRFWDILQQNGDHEGVEPGRRWCGQFQITDLIVAGRVRNPPSLKARIESDVGTPFQRAIEFNFSESIDRSRLTRGGGRAIESDQHRPQPGARGKLGGPWDARATFNCAWRTRRWGWIGRRWGRRERQKKGRIVPALCRTRDAYFFWSWALRPEQAE